MPKKFLVLTLAAILAGFILANKPKACTGAEAAAQGYSTLVTEETANSVYGNMAGLAFLEKPEIQYTYTKDPTNFLESENVVSFGMPIKDSWGVGFQYWSSDFQNWKSNKTSIKEDVFKIVAGTRIISHDKINFAVGGEFFFVNRGETENKNNLKKKSIYGGGSSNAYFKYKFSENSQIKDEFRAGILFQGLHNIRPGLSYAIKYDALGIPSSTRISASYYDLLGGLKLRKNAYESMLRKPFPFKDWKYGGPRVGIEQKIGSLAIRGGIDNSIKIIPRSFIGIGINIGDYLSLDYTKEISNDLKDVSYIGLGFKF